MHISSSWLIFWITLMTLMDFQYQIILTSLGRIIPGHNVFLKYIVEFHLLMFCLKFLYHVKISSRFLLHLFLNLLTVRVQAEAGERERVRESQASSALSVQRTAVGAQTWNREIVTWADTKSWMPNRLNHTGAPHVCILSLPSSRWGWLTSKQL